MMSFPSAFHFFEIRLLAALSVQILKELKDTVNPVSKKLCPASVMEIQKPASLIFLI